MIYHPIDDAILEYQTEEGQSIEPIFYIPILPMVLVNGCEGIGTGFSSTIPNFSPFDIIANIKRYINDEMLIPMTPWFKGFKGSIIPNDRAGFDVVGKYDVVEYDVFDSKNGSVPVDIIRITELPVKKWTQDYKEFLESSVMSEDSQIIGFNDKSSHEHVDFEVHVKAGTTDLEKLLKLRSSISLTNLTLFDTNRKLTKYPNELAILKEFANERLKAYGKRKEYLLVKYTQDLKILSNQVRFIKMVINEEIVIFNRKKVDLITELKRLKFEPMDEDEEKGEYDYLLSMQLWNLTKERVDKLNENHTQAGNLLEMLKGMTTKQMWLDDLRALEEALKNFEKGSEEGEMPSTSHQSQSKLITNLNKHRKIPKNSNSGKRKKSIGESSSQDIIGFASQDYEIISPSFADSSSPDISGKPITLAEAAKRTPSNIPSVLSFFKSTSTVEPSTAVAESSEADADKVTRKDYKIEEEKKRNFDKDDHGGRKAKKSIASSGDGKVKKVLKKKIVVDDDDDFIVDSDYDL